MAASFSCKLFNLSYSSLIYECVYIYMYMYVFTYCIFPVCSGWHTLSQLCIRIQTLTECYTEAGQRRFTCIVLKKKLILIDTNVCSKMTLILICFQMVEDMPILIIQTLTSALFLQVLRIAQELSSLSTSLPLELSSSIFVRTVSKFWTSIYFDYILTIKFLYHNFFLFQDDDKITLMKALITG